MYFQCSSYLSKCGHLSYLCPLLKLRSTYIQLSIFWKLIPNVRNESSALIIPTLEESSSQAHQRGRHLWRDNLNVLLRYVPDASIFYAGSSVGKFPFNATEGLLTEHDRSFDSDLWKENPHCYGQSNRSSFHTRYPTL